MKNRTRVWRNVYNTASARAYNRRFTVYVFVIILFFTDIDECLASPCNALASYSCNNTNGSYECACKKGYEFDGVSCVGM